LNIGLYIFGYEIRLQNDSKSAAHCNGCAWQHTATHCNTLQHTGAFLIVDMTPLIANRALLTGDRALLQKGARFIVFDALLVENRVLALKYRARIRPRMEKSHFGRPRTGDQPICICSIAE